MSFNRARVAAGSGVARPPRDSGLPLPKTGSSAWPLEYQSGLTRPPAMIATAAAAPKIQEFLRRAGRWRSWLRDPRRGPYSARSGRLLDNCASGRKNWNERAASPTLDAFPSVKRIGMVDLAAHRTFDVDHVAAPPNKRRNNILFWDIETRLAIIQRLEGRQLSPPLRAIPWETKASQGRGRADPGRSCRPDQTTTVVRF